MKKVFKKITLGILTAVLVACSTEDEIIEDWIDTNTVDVPQGTAGTLDFSNFVAIGNSLTAGFADGALFNEGQANSFPNLLAGQFASVDASVEFNQPDINSENGFNGTFSSSTFIAGRTELSLTLLAPVPTAGEVITPFSGDKATLGNFGVPGLTLSNLDLAGYGFPGDGNPYFERFASDPNTASVLGDALAVDRSFFSFWLGSNDYLVYAASGGQGDAPLTTYDAGTFGADLSSALGQLTANGTPGVVLDLLPVVTLPFFQAIQWNAIDIDATLADTLNTGLAAVNGAIQGTTQVGYTGDVTGRLISYVEGPNPILVHDEELDDLGPFFDILQTVGQIDAVQRAQLAPYEQSRPLVAGELVTLAAGAVLNTEADGDDTEPDTPIGIVIPLGFSFTAPANGDQYFLSAEEQANIVTARATYNGVISATVNALNDAGADIALVSLQSTFVDLLGLDVPTATALALPTGSADGVSGIVIDGTVLAPDFTPNGVISTDGIHPNGRGHAIVANLIIDAINARWGASIPSIDVLATRGTYFQP